MFLTKQKILQSIESDEIHVLPFNPKNLGPNSIDVTLCDKLKVYRIPESGHLDMRQKCEYDEITIPEDGFVLEPGVLYIGSTNEAAISWKYVPMFEGRSSIGRLGISTHVTAGFGDVGWGYDTTLSSTANLVELVGHKNENGEDLWANVEYPTWTLEITVVHPIRVYPNVRIGQVYFVETLGEPSLYKGKYSSQKGPQESLSYRDFDQRL